MDDISLGLCDDCILSASLCPVESLRERQESGSICDGCLCYCREDNGIPADRYKNIMELWH